MFVIPACLYAQVPQPRGEKTLTSGMKITKSMKIKKAVYRIDATANTEGSLITIEGNDITLDFNNAELKGSNKKINPDEFFGIAIIIKNSKNVTIKNLKVRGYKVALLARNTERLILEIVISAIINATL